MSGSVYLDHNASAALRPEARAAAERTLALIGNGSSVHRNGREVRAAVEESREALAGFLCVDREAVIFTSGASEANNQVICGLGTERVLASAVEHPSILSARDDVESIAVTRDGVIDLEALSAQLASGNENALVCVMAANNETGVVQPVAEVVQIAHEAGALVHCDAVQALGKIEFSPDVIGADTYAVSGHKIGAMSGVGALVIANDRILPKPLIKGGGQERSYRAGTENVVGIASFGAAAAALDSTWRNEAERTRAMRDELEADLPAHVRIVGVEAERLPNTSNLIMRGVESERQVMALDLAGIAVSAGAACSSGKVKRSAVLAAMGFDDEDAGAAIRVSLGWNTESTDLKAFSAAYRRLSDRPADAA